MTPPSCAARGESPLDANELLAMETRLRRMEHHPRRAMIIGARAGGQPRSATQPGFVSLPLDTRRGGAYWAPIVQLEGLTLHCVGNLGRVEESITEPVGDERHIMHGYVYHHARTMWPAH
jgi:hypothetical protein